MATQVKFVTVPSKTLVTSINSSAYAIQISDIIGWDGNALTSANFGGVLWAVLRNSTNTQMEIMQLDPATIANSQITVLLRGLDFSGGLVEVTANKLTWIKNDTIIELGTNPPQLLTQMVAVSGNQSIADLKTFTTLPQSAVTPVNPTDFVTKAYADALTFAGAPNASLTVQGLVQLGTQAQIDARTATGSTGAALSIPTTTLRSTLLSDYKADTGSTNTYVITPSPAITAYAVGQIFTFKAANTNSGASTLNVNGIGVKNIFKVNGATALASGDIASGQIIQVEYDGTQFQMLTPVGNAPAPAATAALQSSLRFGGTGVDGALAVSSGTTTIDLANAAIVVKNYSSISITGTGLVNFINPNVNGTLVLIRSQGNVTLTSSTAPMLDFSGLGGAGGTNGSTGVTGSTGNLVLDSSTHGGTGGQVSSGTAGTGGAILGNLSFYSRAAMQLSSRSIFVYCGSGGGGGGNAQGGALGTPGGNGGGAFIIECGGALNFTTAGGISVNGISAAAISSGSGGGGGGGSAGSGVILYNTLTAASGTITAVGGNGGNSFAGGGTVQSGGGGGGAGGFGGAGGAGGAGGNDAAGVNGNAGAGVGAGGGGAGGSSGVGAAKTGGSGGSSDTAAGLIAQNLYFV